MVKDIRSRWLDEQVAVIAQIAFGKPDIDAEVNPRCSPITTPPEPADGLTVDA
jgi:hypothetical protein